MIVVSGASGQLGRRVVEHLLGRVGPERIGVSGRDPGKLADFAARGVRVRAGDFEDEASLQHAWEGAERLLLVSSNAAASGGDPLAQHARAIRVAQALGVGRVFYTSQMASSAQSAFPPAVDHAATEAMLTQSGLQWTALRHGFYAQSGLQMNQQGFSSGTLAVPEDGKVAWTTHDDLAAADAALLVGDTVIDGPTPPLTGREALDFGDLAALASALGGKPVGRVVVGDRETEERVRAAGVPSARLAIMMGYFQAARRGEFSRTDPLLERLIGREPQSMAAFMKSQMAHEATASAAQGD